MRISFFTVGCRLNQSETAVLQNMFAASGFQVVDFDSAADVVVINTCTVTREGDAETRRLVNRISRRHPAAAIALVGCQVQVQGRRLARFPNVKWLVGNAAKMDLVNILTAAREDGRPRICIPKISRRNFTVPLAGRNPNRTRAHLKVQDGCDFFCSFCEVPYARGRPRSRVFADIIREGRALVDSGYKEIVLTGTNVGLYRDAGLRLADVIRQLAGIEGLGRLRISSVELATLPPGIFDEMMPAAKLCRFLHVPLQSGDDSLLTLMNRHYRAADFLDFVLAGRSAVPDICLGTDVIVGFPGESESHFQATYEFLDALPISYLHVFSYSRRQKAIAKDFPGHIPDEAIQRRSQALRALGQKKRLAFYRSQAGRTQHVLFEQKKNGCWTGLTDNYIRVKVKSGFDLANQLRPVKLTACSLPAMEGTLC